MGRREKERKRGEEEEEGKASDQKICNAANELDMYMRTASATFQHTCIASCCIARNG